MARSGSFGTSLNPFGTGSFGGLSQYDIGDNLKDLEAYRLEIAWGNGEITDEEYAASLTKLVAAATPGTQTQLSAQNKLDDVTYRIGRSRAEAQGPDALIAFDQQALAGMNPGNLRYRDLKDTLNAELAQRRSRDYGLLVDAYNAGQTSTESLLDWVEKTVASLPPDAPDRDNWASVEANLVERTVSEKDAQVYQDYQDGTMKPADFLAYLTGRRDAYDMSSPKWAEADRRLKDAQKNVKDAANAKADQAFFNLYAEGKKSNESYLLYVSRRIDGMEPDDPQLPEWKHKLALAAHSIAEDKLRHEVTMATTAAADARARKNLRDFYVAYKRTLNPGSSEYRHTEEQILALKPRTGTGGGGKGNVVKGDEDTPKVIPTTGNFDHIITLLTPNPHAPKKDQAVAVAALRLNLDSAQNAKNDKVWLYTDPRYPGQMVTRRNPDGTVWKDPKTGKTEKIPGSSYRLTSSDEIAGMQMATATYSYGLAGIALHGGVVGGKAVKGGDFKGYWTALWHANTALDAARSTQAHAVQKDITNQLKAYDEGIEAATKLNDNALVVNLLMMKGQAIRQGLADATLDDAQRDRLLARADQIENDPRLPVFETDMQGNPVYGPDGKRVQVGGFVDVVNSPRNADGSLVFGAAVLAPDVHFMLDTDAKGNPAWGLVRDTGAPGMWGLNHVTVQTGAFGQRVVGEVQVTKAPTLGLWVTTQDGTKKHIPYPGDAQFISYVDGYGNRVTGYSIDRGATWVRATGGVLPQLELNGKVTWTTAADGSIKVTDGAGKELFASPDGVNWGGGGTALDGAPISWYGQAAVMAGGVSPDGVGAQGQQFRIVRAVPGPDGAPTLNLVPREIIYAEITAANAAANVTRVQNAGAAAGASLAEESGAIRVRGLRGTPTTPETDATAWRRQKQADAAAIRGQETNAAARTWDTLAEENAAVRERGSGDQWRTAGALATSLVNQATPAVTGILSLGATLMNAVTPPTWLPPVYISPKVGFTLSPPPLKSAPATLPPPVKAVTPPLVVRRGTTPTPSGDENRIYEPEPVVKKTPVYTGPLGR